MDNRCVMCNEIIPSGRQVCWICEHKIMEGRYDDRIIERAKDKIPTEE